jgi:hypothetical protein
MTNGAWWALGAVAGIAALGKRGSLAREPNIWPGHQVRGKTKKGKLPGISLGSEVKVYFNLTAQYEMMYGGLDNVNEANILTKIRAPKRPLPPKACVPTAPKDKALLGMYRSGAIYSLVKAGKVQALARAVELKNVIFTTTGGAIKDIRNRGSKAPCCFVRGELVSYDGAAREAYDKVKRRGQPVGINPMRNDTFVRMGPPYHGSPVFTAERVFLLHDPKNPIGRPPGMVIAFGVNKKINRGYKRGRRHTAKCGGSIRGVEAL